VKRFCTVTALVVTLAAGGVTDARLASQPAAQALQRCGVERWPVKTLSDPAAAHVNFTPHSTTVQALRSLANAHTTSSTPRLPGTERSTFRLTAELVAFKREADKDIHLVVSTPGARTKTMIVEFPDTAHCNGAGTSAHRAAMAAARAALTTACGAAPGSTFQTLHGTAAITGVGFFDIHHATPQRGVAPNDIELHPVLSFHAPACRRG
jgi:hypothetical protein